MHVRRANADLATHSSPVNSAELMGETMQITVLRMLSDQQLSLRYAQAMMVCLTFVAFAGTRASGVEMRWGMYEDPVLKKPAVETGFPSGLIDRWLQALTRPEREMKRKTALAIVEAVDKQVPGLEATIEPLCSILREPDPDRMVRLSVAQALVALDAHKAAPVLVEVADPRDLEMAEIVEPALTRWGDRGLCERWIERLNGEVGLLRFHVLAIRGLASLKQKDAVPRLLELATDPYAPPEVRLEAADGLGVIEASGLLDTARELCDDGTFAGVVDRLVAARMVAGHRGDEAESFFLELAVDPLPSVGSIALGYLCQIDARLILPVIEETVASQDANVRRWGAEALIACPSAAAFEVLVPMLNDADPEIRRDVCDRLVSFAETAAFQKVIVEEARNVLNADGWRGQEQAILLLVTLKDTAIVDRLIELLDMSRQEVNVTAAWGLSELAVPSTSGPVHEVLQKKTESWLAGAPQNDGIGDQLALLAQLLGVLKYAPADPVLRKYIRKGTALDAMSRSAAIWALGKIHAGEPDEELANLLEKRVLDAFGMVPEDPAVCRMSAIALGRMKADSVVESLRSSLAQSGMQSGFGYACAWAIREMRGEEIPPLNTEIYIDYDWFLVPEAE